MSQQRGQTLNDIELLYHASKTETEALVATLLREYKRRFNELAQQNQIQMTEKQRLLDKYEPKEKKKESIDSVVEEEEKPNN